jgi:hypothetical protein
LTGGGKLAPGFSPMTMVEKRREAVLTALVCGKNPLKRVLFSWQLVSPG